MLFNVDGPQELTSMMNIFDKEQLETGWFSNGSGRLAPKSQV